MASTTEEVLAILGAHTRRDISDVSPDTPLVELGVDSLDVMEILFAIEERYGVTLPFGAENGSGAALGSIRDLARMVDELIGQPRTKVA